MTNDSAPDDAGAPVSSEALLARALGCKANCHFCDRASEDHDGEHGELFCGTVCTDGKAGDETYLEDAGIDLDAEKPCWVPDFWKVPGHDFHNMIGDDCDPTAAMQAFKEHVERLRANVALTGRDGRQPKADARPDPVERLDPRGPRSGPLGQGAERSERHDPAREAGRIARNQGLAPQGETDAK
jgi:hypothetical protein